MRDRIVFDRQTPLRQSNIELLRIVAMLIIVAHHFSVHGGFVFPADTISVNRLWVQFIQIGGKIGVNVFVLISGYFLIHVPAVKPRKVLKLWTQMLFYAVLFQLLFTGTGQTEFSQQEINRAFLPVTQTQWWFASTYFVLYLLSPYLNRFLTGLRKGKYLWLLAVLTVYWSVIPTFLDAPFESNNLTWFVYLYCLGGYFGRFRENRRMKSGLLIVLSAAATLLTFSSAVVYDFLGQKNEVYANLATYFYGMQMLPILVISVLLFLGFEGLRLPAVPLVNKISSATFGVYLIHDHDLVRPFLWRTLFRNAEYSDAKSLIPYSVGVILLVFVVCTVIEWIRQNTIERLCRRPLDAAAAKIESALKKLSELPVFQE